MTYWIKWASFLMFIGVILGAFGSHILKNRLSFYQMDIFHTAVFYHFLHALGLFAVAWLATQTQDAKVSWAGCFFLVGIVLFCGSLYILAVTEIKWFGIITPIGGISFLIGWALLFFSKVGP